MQIVIDIPYKDFEKLATFGQFNSLDLAVAVEKGIVLPKGHGRLIDADKVVEVAEKIEEDGATFCIDKPEDLETFLDDEVPTLLDAEREE